MLSHFIFVIMQELQKTKVNAKFLPSYTNQSHVAFLLKFLDIKKASGLDEIPPKLVKAASDILSIPLS